MPDPAAKLPPELFDSIIEIAFNEWPFEGPSLRKGLCLVNKAWRQPASRLRYREFLFSATGNSARTLWRFMTTVIRNPEVASHVIVVDVRTWGSCKNFHGFPFEHTFEFLTDEDHKFFKQALSRAGFGDLIMHACDDLWSESSSAIMALILTHLPNLKMLWAQIPKDDIFFTRLLNLATSPGNSQRPLRNLQEGHLAIQGDYLEFQAKCFKANDIVPFDIYDMKPEFILPILSLPKMRKLSLFDLDPTNAKWSFGSRELENITELRVGLEKRGKPDDLGHFVELFKNLNLLSINVPKGTTNIPAAKCIQDIWKVCFIKKETLEYLCIYQERGSDAKAVNLSGATECAQCCPLRSFPHLKSASITPEHLVSNCNHTKQPFRLANHIPPTLESLTLYPSETAEDMPKATWDQLTTVIESKPHLKTITLDIEGVTPSRHISKGFFGIPLFTAGPTNPPIPPPPFAKETLQAAEAHGVKFQILRASYREMSAFKDNFRSSLLHERSEFERFCDDMVATGFAMRNEERAEMMMGDPDEWDGYEY